MKTMIKLNELSFDLFPHPPYSPDLAPSDYWLFIDLKKILQGKRFCSNEEVISETESYFESKDESFYKKGIENFTKLRIFIKNRTFIKRQNFITFSGFIKFCIFIKKRIS